MSLSPSPARRDAAICAVLGLPVQSEQVRGPSCCCCRWHGQRFSPAVFAPVLACFAAEFPLKELVNSSRHLVFSDISYRQDKSLVLRS